VVEFPYSGVDVGLDRRGEEERRGSLMGYGFMCSC
jgi:hypothetical protein